MNLLLRCALCGGATPYRPGARFCAMCAAPIATACPACQQDCLAGERYCACCGTAVQVEAHPRPVGAGPARPVPGDRQELAMLAADLKLRSESEQARTDFGNKRHLAQADLDEMFAS